MDKNLRKCGLSEVYVRYTNIILFKHSGLCWFSGEPSLGNGTTFIKLNKEWGSDHSENQVVALAYEIKITRVYNSRDF